MNGNCTATSVQLICFCLPISVLLLETKERIQLKKESIGHNNVSPPMSDSIWRWIYVGLLIAMWSSMWKKWTTSGQISTIMRLTYYLWFIHILQTSVWIFSSKFVIFWSHPSFFWVLILNSSINLKRKWKKGGKGRYIYCNHGNIWSPNAPEFIEVLWSVVYGDLVQYF